MLLLNYRYKMNINVWILIHFFILIHSFLAAELGTSRISELYGRRIIGGIDAKRAERPFQVFLRIGDRFCGGSIISKEHILTAAHCLHGKNYTNVKVTAGITDIRQPNNSTYEASKVIIHEHYNEPKRSYLNDIALIKLAQPLKFSKLIRRIRLPKANMTIPKWSTAVVSGWGYKSTQNPRPSKNLQEAKILIPSLKYCRKAMEMKNVTIYPSQVCALNRDQRRGQCRGDSGGPLTLRGILIGIVSFSLKDPDCGSIIYPGVYTRVASYIGWIKGHMDSTVGNNRAADSNSTVVANTTKVDNTSTVVSSPK